MAEAFRAVEFDGNRSVRGRGVNRRRNVGLDLECWALERGVQIGTGPKTKELMISRVMVDSGGTMLVRLILLSVLATLSVEARASDAASSIPANNLSISTSFFTNELIKNLNDPTYMKSRTDLFQKWHQRSYEYNGKLLQTGEIGFSINSDITLTYDYRNDNYRIGFGGNLVASLILCSSSVSGSVNYNQTLESLRHRYPKLGERGNIQGETLQISQHNDTDFYISHFTDLPDYVQCLGIVSYTERSP